MKPAETTSAAAPAAGGAGAASAPAVPPWLTPQLLTSALREEDEATGQVTTIRVRPATATNENYLSELFRVHAHIGKSDVRRLIVKAVPAGETSSAIVNACGFFARETRMLKDTLPRLQWQLAAGLSHRPHHHLQIGPKVIATCSNGALLMEDLAARGYCNVSRREGLDLPHSLVSVRLLARMHAASLSLHARSPEHARTLEGYGKGWADKSMREPFTRLFTSSMQTLATAARQWPRLGEAVAARLTKAAGGAPQRALDVVAAKKGDFEVLCHGDAWSNNIMFDYDEETAQVRSALLVDFQMVSWASPAMDLHYFLALAVAPWVRREHSGRVVRAYHAELLAALGAMGWPGDHPALAALQKDLRAREYWAFFSAVCLLPIRYVETGLAMDSEAMLTRDHPTKIKTLNHPACRATLEELIPEYITKGFLD